MPRFPRLHHAARRLHLGARLALDPWHRWRLGRRHPELAGVADALDARARALRAPRRDYVASVSRDAMAASAELCALALEACRRRDARRVADLGSGFSSYALRSLARERGGLEVWSVDDEEEWLERTRRFLGERGLPVERCVLWSTVAGMSSLRGSFDLVIHDLGHAGGAGPSSTPERARHLGAALDLVRPGGLLLLDDVQALPYRRLARSILKRRAAKVYPMVRATLDRFGRYAWLAVVRG